MRDEIINALEILQRGGLILYPTDTIWGIGCDATNEKAVAKIYEIKKRIDSKSMLVLIDNENRIRQYVTSVPEIAWDLLDVSDTPMTIIYPDAKNLAENLISEDNSIGIRVTSEEFSQNLIKRFKRPIVSTSANYSGESTPSTFSEISEKIKKEVDYIVNWKRKDTSKNKPSSIIKIGVDSQIKIIRK